MMNRFHLSVMWRFIAIVSGTAVAVAITFALGPIQNSELATGAAMSIAVLGLSLLTGWSGQVSLGNSGFLLVGGYTAGVWAQHHNSSPIVVTLILAALTGAAAGVILGLPATRLRGPYLAGMTLTFAVVLPTLAQNLTWLTDGFNGLSLNYIAPPGWFASLFSGPYASINAQQQWITDCSILVAGFAFLGMSNIFHSKTGRAMRLVRDDDVAAELMGVNVARTRVLAFAISASFASVAGALLVLWSGTVFPQSFPFAMSIELLTITVLGGMGTLSGAAIAGVVYAFSATWVDWVNAHTGISPGSNLGRQMGAILFAGVLILTMIFAPRGIMGAVSGLWRRIGASTRGRATPPEVPPTAPEPPPDVDLAPTPEPA